MSRTVQAGSIPESITFISSGSTKVSGFDPLSRWWETNPDTQLEVVPAYISDSTNAKTLETGRTWATRRWEYVDGKRKTKDKVDEVTMPNTPFKGPRVVNLETRGEGGLVWKIMLPTSHNNYYIDMRKDVITDTMLTDGVKDGVLQGSYVFGRHGSKMTLVRVGSSLHRALTLTTERKATKVLSAKDLVPGTLYRTKGGKTKCYVGRCDTVEFQETGRDGEPYRESYNWNNGPKQIVRTDHTNHFLWVEIPDYQLKTPAEVLKSGYYIELTKSHNMIEEVGELKAANSVAKIRKIVTAIFDKGVARIQQGKEYHDTSMSEFIYHRTDAEKSAAIRGQALYQSKQLNIVEAGTPRDINRIFLTLTL